MLHIAAPLIMMLNDYGVILLEMKHTFGVDEGLIRLWGLISLKRLGNTALYRRRIDLYHNIRHHEYRCEYNE